MRLTQVGGAVARKLKGEMQTSFTETAVDYTVGLQVTDPFLGYVYENEEYFADPQQVPFETKYFPDELASHKWKKQKKWATKRSVEQVKEQVNNLHTKREAIEWRSGLRVTDELQLYVHDGVEYLPDSKAVPFTTSATFNAANWVLSELMTQMKHWRDKCDPRGFGAVSGRNNDSTVAIKLAVAAKAAQGGGSVPILCDYGISDTISFPKGVYPQGNNPKGKGGGSNFHWNPTGTEAEYRMKNVLEFVQPDPEFLDSFAKFTRFSITSEKKALAAIFIGGDNATAWFDVDGVVINPDNGTPYNTPSDQFLFGIWSLRGFSWKIGGQFYIRNCVIGVHQNGNDCTSSTLSDGFIQNCRYHLVAEGLTGFESSGMSYEAGAIKRIVIGNNKTHWSNSCNFSGNYCYGWGDSVGTFSENSVYVDKDIRPIYEAIDAAYDNWYSDALAKYGRTIPDSVNQTDPSGISFKNNLLSGAVHVPDDSSCVEFTGNTYSLTADRSLHQPMLQELLNENIAGGAERVAAYKYRREDAAYSIKDIKYIAQRQVGEFAIAFDYPNPVVLAEFSVVNADTRYAIITVNIESFDNSFSDLTDFIHAKARISFTANDAKLSLTSNVAGSYLYLRLKGGTDKVVNIGDKNIDGQPNTVYELIADTGAHSMSGQVIAMTPTNGITCKLRV